MYEGGEDVDLVLVLMGEVVEEVEEVEGKDSRVAIEFNTGSVSVESKSSTAVPSKLLGLDAWQTASRRTAAATLTRFRFMVNKLVLHKAGRGILVTHTIFPFFSLIRDAQKRLWL